MVRRPIIAIAGLACETSTFTPSRTLAPAFHPKRGDEIIQRYQFLHADQPLGQDAEWKGALTGHALPGGVVTRDAFETLAAEILHRLRDIAALHKLDGLWLDIHGAMVVEGIDDSEAELLRRIRRVTGAHVIVSASMDLHGNVSRDLAQMCDLITCYRMAPHEDAMETKERACRNLVGVLKSKPPGARPLKAWVPIPVLLPGEQTSTRTEPAKHIYAAVPEVEATEGVVDAAIWVGYAWADEPRNRAVVMVTGWDKPTVARGAEQLARLFWDARAAFEFVAPTGSYAECLDAAVASPASQRPYFISDSGDNPTAGGSGDVTWGLARLLERPEFQDAGSGYAVIYASVPGPEAVGSVYAILTKLRKPYHKERDFTELGLRPRAADVVIVKIGYLEPELYDMAKGWMLALTPGGVDQDLERLGHHRIRRPMWPFDKAFEKEPDLGARWISASNEPLEGPDE
ncbi:hypothetical protein H634G_01334 [Metarhizium anisopliae BRIP 53293]|uniref:Microcystinase C n=1 Tax=Metarhizium anisopliae BRIP 53293 TaxID=1291518 RepID=A0A0D9PEG8_METAN|nr:hypothetical protein H634G_01334 [Metarhizium anisopliae BRIP 53293]KJK93278.1 hypothetical protein H633G_02814 [Metarhizium anisopliae BRIP 53284]